MSRLINAIARAEKAVWSGSLNIVFVNDPGIKKINKKFLLEPGTTDVIAFRHPILPGWEKADAEGDIYICVPEAVRNGRRFGQTPGQELIRYAAHGFLHLLGYDDHKANDRRVMWERQEQYVGRLGGRS